MYQTSLPYESNDAVVEVERQISGSQFSPTMYHNNLMNLTNIHNQHYAQDTQSYREQFINRKSTSMVSECNSYASYYGHNSSGDSDQNPKILSNIGKYKLQDLFSTPTSDISANTETEMHNLINESVTQASKPIQTNLVHTKAFHKQYGLPDLPASSSSLSYPIYNGDVSVPKEKKRKIPYKKTVRKPTKVIDPLEDDESQMIEDANNSDATEDVKKHRNDGKNKSSSGKSKIMEPSKYDVQYSSIFVRDPHGTKETGRLNAYTAEESYEKACNLKNSKLQNMLYQCRYCPLKFEHHKRFLIHFKWHNFGRKHLVNNVQKKKAVEIISKVEKEEIPVEDGDFKCEECGKSFTNFARMKSHVTMVHVREHRCLICGEVFATWKEMSEHSSLAHPAVPADGYQCLDCPKMFKSKHTLVKHSFCHKEKTVSCPECPKLFASEAILQMHKKTHERRRLGATFHCSYCPKGFYASYNLQVHERTKHRNEKPFQCTICGVHYGTNSSLQRHLKVSHNTAKPHNCDTCHRSFVSLKTLSRHQAVAHDVPRHKCSVCDCSFSRKLELTMHKRKMHGRNKECDSDG